MLTFAQAGEDAAFLADVAEKLEAGTAAAGTGFVDIEAAFRDQVRGDIAQRNIARTQALTQRLGSVIRRATLLDLATDAWREVANSTEVQFEQARGGNLTDVIRAIYDAMARQGFTIQGSGDAYGPFAPNGNIGPPAGPIVGDGFVDRLAVDENGFPLEGWSADATYDLTCVSDSRSAGVNEFEERFDLTSTPRGPNNLRLSGSGLTVRSIVCLSERVSTRYIRNPTWQLATGLGAGLNTLDGWQADVGAFGTDIQLDEGAATAYRTLAGQTPRSLRFTGTIANAEISPNLAGGGILPQLTKDTPFWWGIPVQRVSTASGTVEIRFSPTSGAGGVAATLDLTTLPADGWGILKLPVNSSLWEKSLGQANAVPRIRTIGLSGECRLGGHIFGPMTKVGLRNGIVTRGRGSLGQYVAIVAGQTGWGLNDQLRATDTPGSRAKLHTWLLYEARIGYLPTSLTPTIADRP